MTTIGIIDLETTGDNAEEHDIVEAALVTIRESDGRWSKLNQWNSLVGPIRDIPAEASAVHHITKSDLKKEGFVLPNKEFWRTLTENCDYIAAHNAGFDRSFLPNLGRPWICTWRCSLHLWPKAPKHNLQTLRYWREIETHPQGYPHRALYDAQVTADLLMHMLKKRSADELLHLSTQPVLLETVRFGKHRGQKWKDLPKDYLKWLLQKDFDEDVKFTAKHYLEAA